MFCHSKVVLVLVLFANKVNQSEKIYNIVHGDMDITLQKSLGDCLNVYRMSRINKYCSCVNRSAISNWYRDKLLFCVL